MVFNPQRKDTSSLYVAGGPLSAGASDRSQSIHFTSHVRSRVAALRGQTLVLT